jgi:hypothetical protein
MSEVVLALMGSAILVLGAGTYFLMRGFTWARLRKEPSFGLAILLGTMVLPQLAAFPVDWIGGKIPTNANDVMALTSGDILRIALFVMALAIPAIGIGLLWNRREWLVNAHLYGIFAFSIPSLHQRGGICHRAGGFVGLLAGAAGGAARQPALVLLRGCADAGV